jgi:ADP-heptose:LPS heptosyltransferase
VEILVLHPGALGDLILALPAISLLRSRFPQAVTTLAGNVDFVPALAPGYVDRVVSLATLPLHGLYASEPDSDEIRQYWARYDLVVSWTGSGDPHFSANLARLCPHAVVAGWKPRSGETRHVSRIFVDSLVPWLGQVEAIPVPSVSILRENRCRATGWLAGLGWGDCESIVAIHPGAGGVVKRWPAERFVSVSAAMLQRPEVRILLIEGPAEPGSGRRIANELPPDRVAVAEALDLELLAALFARCRVFVGNDSGIAHLAAALAIPCLVLFGPTNPLHWAPCGKAVQVVRETSGRIEDISAELVHQRLLILFSL